MCTLAIFSRLLRDFFNIDAARRRGHHNRRPGRSIVRNPGKFLFQCSPTSSTSTLRTGKPLISIAKIWAANSVSSGFFARLNPPAFLSSSHQHLRFNYCAATQFLCNLLCFVCGNRYSPHGIGTPYLANICFD